VHSVANDLRRDSLGRTGVVGQLLVSLLPSLRSDGLRPAVLDCGGGSGTFAVPLAQAGADVTVVDISIDALATLNRRAAEGAVADHVVGLQADLDLQFDVLAGRTFDLVVAHGILEVLDDSAAAFALMAGVLPPGGVLSVLVTNPAAGVLSRALAGDVAAALRDLRELDGREARVGPASVEALGMRHGLLIDSVQGVGVFSELIPGAAVDAPGVRDVLAELEAASAARSPFRDIATRQHLLMRRPRDGQ
jgi:SAM-dependent methyltransferase